MLNQFQKFLINKGYKEFSANGSPSTVIDYAWRISKICEKEGITEQQLGECISTVLKQYDLLLKESEDKEVIGTVCSQILNKYEELVLKNVN